MEMLREEIHVSFFCSVPLPSPFVFSEPQVSAGCWMFTIRIYRSWQGWVLQRHGERSMEREPKDSFHLDVRK